MLRNRIPAIAKEYSTDLSAFKILAAGWAEIISGNGILRCFDQLHFDIGKVQPIQRRLCLAGNIDAALSNAAHVRERYIADGSGGYILLSIYRCDINRFSASPPAGGCLPCTNDAVRDDYMLNVALIPQLE